MNNTLNKNQPPVKTEATPQIETLNKPKFQKREINEPVVREKIVYKEKDSGLGKIGCGCRTISCGGCILIIALIIAIIYIVINKPPAVWSGVVDFLNDSIVMPTHNGKTSESSKAELNEQIKTVGDVDIIVTESQLTALGREKLTGFKDLVIDVKPEVLSIYWKMDETVQNKPLIGIIEMRLDSNNKIYISKIGTNKIGSPEFLNDALTTTAYSILNFGNNTPENKYGFLLNLIPATNTTFKSISFEEAKVVIKANVKVDLFK